MKNDCIDCKDRHVGCQITCPSYRKYREILDQKKKDRDMFLMAERYRASMHYEGLNEKLVRKQKARMIARR